MYSTLGDMLRFYDYARNSGVFEPQQIARFNGRGRVTGGSDQGFYYFHAYDGPGNDAVMLINVAGPGPDRRALSDALALMVQGVDE